jgi:hypothetical protein
MAIFWSSRQWGSLYRKPKPPVNIAGLGKNVPGSEAWYMGGESRIQIAVTPQGVARGIGDGVSAQLDKITGMGMLPIGRRYFFAAAFTSRGCRQNSSTA